jgi:hypothetical protein
MATNKVIGLHKEASNMFNFNKGTFLKIPINEYIEQLKRCEYIQDDRAVKKLCEKAKELLIKEENIIYLNAPITVSKNNNKNYNYNYYL